VTEAITGIDLVREQISVASGAPLSFSQADVRFTGHAIECRINAEDATAGFAPSPGVLRAWQPPPPELARTDSHCHAGYAVPPFYDSLLAKLIVHGEDRSAAIERMLAALDAFEIEGTATTRDFSRAIVADGDFRAGRVTTAWLENEFLHRHLTKTEAQP
jgi:acetyl-CoA carboxylase biotin carboxylase subunit